MLDIVPNHMAISGRRNRWWWDVLENGPSSRYASYFDIDWNTTESALHNKMLVPILGDHYGRVLARRELQIGRHDAEFIVKYFDNELPVAPRSLPCILSAAASRSGSDYLAFLSDALDLLPAASATDPASLARRHRDKAIVQGLLDNRLKEVPHIADAVDAEIKELNRNTDRLHDFLERQNFRLAYWRTAEQDLIYRRFFDVNTLVGLRMEREQVFADTHALVLRWLREGVLDGIRVDHPDGLQDPRAYFEHLRRESPDVWILGEKILEPGEKLRPEWPIDGTTGYDYLNQAGGLLVNSANEQEFNRIYTEFTGETTDYPAMCRDKKHRVLRDLLGSDVNRLTTLFLEVCKSHRDRRDFTRQDVIRSIRELVACFPVYRTYVVPDREEITADDECYVNEAVNAAKQNRPELDPDLFDFLGQVLLLKERGPKEAEFVERFQQFTGPAMAKGVEDTVFYNYNRLISLNEVGGDPGVFGIAPEKFHAWCAETQHSHPHTMLSSSTHDTKRSEDVRARISLLSEIPGQWEAALKSWNEMNAGLKQDGAPEPNTEYLIYQTLIGTWPITQERLLAYVEKASREAKNATSWLLPNKSFEEGTKAFIEGLYKSDRFLSAFESFLQPLVEPGRVNSLTLLLLKLTSPGIPDMYQGTELWDLSLVDPDNRRPVDYCLRRRLLSELPNLTLREAWKRQDDGLPKLLVLSKVVRLRQQQPEDFGPEAAYRPMKATGEKAEHLVSYLRGENILVLAPRLVMALGGHWGDTSISLPDGQWHSALGNSSYSGGKKQVSELLKDFPVELLVRK